MAWLSLFGGLLFPGLVLFSESDQLGAIAGAFYLFVSAVVGAYIGFSTMDDKWHKLSDPPESTEPDEASYTDPEDRFR
jgi:hypothetical protein